MLWGIRDLYIKEFPDTLALISQIEIQWTDAGTLNNSEETFLDLLGRYLNGNFYGASLFIFQPKIF